MISSFGERVKTLRMEKGMTQIQLAESMNTTKGSVSAWERDLRTPSKAGVEKLCQLFDVSWHYIMGYSESRHDSSEEMREMENEATINRADDVRDLAMKIKQFDSTSMFVVRNVVNALYAQDKKNNKLLESEAITVDIRAEI